MPPNAPAPDAPDVRAPLLETDALIIGAGPAGLFAVFELGLLGIGAHIVDALPHAGGQPLALYGDKPIYDIPAIPACTGRELTERLLQQIAPFAPQWHLGQLLTTVQAQPDGRWLAASDAGTRWLCKTLFIAAGVGAFMPRRLKLEASAALEGRHLHYSLPAPDALAGQRVLVIGGEDAALACASALAQRLGEGPNAPASVALLHRRNRYQAEDAALIARVQAQHQAGTLQLPVGQAQGFALAADGRLQAVQVLGPDGGSSTLPADVVLVMQGFSPKLGPVADWHLEMVQKQLPVDPATCQTGARGIFAVGDINTYPGKQKLILCGFHEATLAAFAAQALIAPEAVQPLQYTTSSTRLHQRLGVAKG